MRRLFLSLLLFGTLGLYAQQPNIVVIVSDDQSFNSIGYTNYGKVYTPTIDMLARNGMIFTNAHHASTVCSPSRYTILTGKFAGRCEGEEYLSLFPPGTYTRTENNCELTRSEKHLGNILGENGYTTGFVGKSHIMEHDILRPANWASYGLKSYAKTDDPYDPAVTAKMKYNHDVYQEIVRSYGFDYADGIYMANVKELNNDALNVHNLEWTVDKARKFIEQSKDQPFFLYFSTTLHHGPVPWGTNNGEYWSSFDADPKLTGEGYIDTTWDFMPTRQEIQDKYVAAGFPERDAYTLLIDEGVKAIYQKVVELNLEENTLIIYMPDHGMWRHGKATLYDFGIKVPMLMYWKGKIMAGSVYDGLVQTVDFLPTILDIAGIEMPTGLETDGISLKTILETGSGDAHSSLFGELGYSRSVKTKDWKYIAIRYPENVQDQVDNGETFPGFDGRILELPSLTANKHLGHYAALNNPHYYEADQLYDLNADSAETVNVYDQHPEVLQEMRELLSEYLLTFENRPFREFTLTAADPPARATTPYPRNGTEDVKTNQVLSWSADYKAKTHEIYFGNTNPPPYVGPRSSAEFDPGILDGATTYYWRIDEKNENGTTRGDTWSFTTGTSEAAAVPENPFPEFNATHVRKNTLLKWDKAAYAAYYKLYMGMETVEHVADLTEEQFDPGYLKSNTVYYWRVDAVNANEEQTVGTPWVFKTGYGNIAPEAKVSVSSVSDALNFGGEKVNDGKFLIPNSGEWRSDGEGTPWMELTWVDDAIVDQINLYDRVGVSSQILNGVIEFSDGSSIQTGTLPANGSVTTLEFSPRRISSLKLNVTESIGEVGLAEIEVYDTVMYVSKGPDVSMLNNFQVIPNPAIGKVIMLRGLLGKDQNFIYLYNIDGQLIAASLADDKEIRFDLSRQAKGIYFIRVVNKVYDQTTKLIL